MLRVTLTHVASSHPLILSDDLHFLARASTWCAALGATPTHHSEALGLRKVWREAEFVVIDAAYISTILGENLPRRDHVFLVGEPSVRNLESALALGVSRLIEPEDGHVVAALAEGAQSGQEACFISVMGACGGVGASTLSAAIAIAAADLGRSAALVDGDAAAGGIEFIIGAERESGLRWTDLQTATGHIDLAELKSVLPSKHGVDVVSFDRDGQTVTSVAPVLNTLVRGYDTVVADVPRHLDDLGAQLVSRSVATVLVVPMRLGGVIAAEHLLPRIQELSGHVLVVAQPVKGGSDQRQLAAKLGVPILTQWPRNQRTFIDVEHGLGPAKGVGRKVAHTVLETLGLV